MGETGEEAAEACLLSQWSVWAVVAFPLQPADGAVRIGPTAIGQEINPQRQELLLPKNPQTGH